MFPPSHHRLVAFVAATAVLVAAAIVCPGPARAAPDPVPDHRPPVAAVVADPFRPPADRFGPGNRGIEYATSEGDAVRASSGGVVAFAGPVGDTVAITIRHSTRLVTTYTHLTEVLVTRGDRVERGQLVARARTSFHFGARLDGDYIDPARLFGRIEVRVRLVSTLRTGRRGTAGLPP